MFVFDIADPDPRAWARRLAHLLANVERGARRFEWSPAAGPGATPEAPLIELEIPAAAAANAGAVAVYRPAVGVIVLPPHVRASRVMRLLAAELEALADGELAGGELRPERPTTLGMAHGALTRFRGAGPSRTFERFIRRTRGDLPPLASAPPHTFTWYIVRPDDVGRQTQVDSPAAFNFALASVYVKERGRAPHERPEPYDEILPEFYEAAPNIPAVARGYVVFEPDAPGSTRGRLAVAPRDLHGVVHHWRDPAAVAPAAAAADVSIVYGGRDGRGEERCARCHELLWGAVYAVPTPVLEPHCLGLCRWCAGVFDPAILRRSRRVPHPRTCADARRQQGPEHVRRTELDGLEAQLLGVTPGRLALIRVEAWPDGRDGQTKPLLLQAGGVGTTQISPNLRHAAAHGHAISWMRLQSCALGTFGGAPVAPVGPIYSDSDSDADSDSD